jgi:hypothetical protein
MRFGIPDIADVYEIRFFSHAERLGYEWVRVTDTTLPVPRHVVPG